MQLLEQQIVETWYINHRCNLLLLNALSNDALELTTSKRGGGSVGHQLAHLYNVRYWRLEVYHKKLIADLATVKSEDEKTIDFLKNLHEVSAERIAVMLKESIEKGGALKGFKRGLIPFLGYILSHEAHHRGNILLTLKNCSYKLPETMKFGLWEWNKI